MVKLQISNKIAIRWFETLIIGDCFLFVICTLVIVIFSISPASLECTETQRGFDSWEGNQTKGIGILSNLLPFGRSPHTFGSLCDLCGSARYIDLLVSRLLRSRTLRRKEACECWTCEFIFLNVKLKTYCFYRSCCLALSLIRLTWPLPSPLTSQPNWKYR